MGNQQHHAHHHGHHRHRNHCQTSANHKNVMRLTKILGAGAALSRFADSNSGSDSDKSPVNVRPQSSVLKKAHSSNYPSNVNNTQENRFNSPQGSLYAPNVIQAQQQQQRQLNASQNRQASFQPNSNGILIGGSQTSDPMELKAICEYCRDIVIHQFYGDHIQYCTKNPQNKKVPCEYCGIEYPMDLIQTHLPNCHARVENILFPCDHCQTPVSLVEQNYHESICQKNPRNKITEVEAQECIICLTEMTRSTQVRFLVCAHRFHEKCINDWSKKQNKCPVCDTSIS